jgi:hypothetical protein
VSNGDWWMNECVIEYGSLLEWQWRGSTEQMPENPLAVPLFTHPHEPSWGWTWAYAVRSVSLGTSLIWIWQQVFHGVGLNSTTNFPWPWPEFNDQFSNALLTRFIPKIENTWSRRVSRSTHISTLNRFVVRRTMVKSGPCVWWNRRKFVIVIGQTGWCAEFEERNRNTELKFSRSYLCIWEHKRRITGCFRGSL